ncbi:MAG TPA: SpoIID/LytB domain-containing protein [Mycobacteriales bacterium]|nr:SpoIID/LytB domain-containing protein [Mycobacteriales bacterium]
MRPGGLRRASWAALAGLVSTSTLTVLALAAPAQASIATNEVYGRPASGSYQLLGHGWGHGHGMSQYGAKGATTLSKTADQITATYYPNTARFVQGNPTMRVLLSTDGRTTAREFVPASGQVMKDLGSGRTFTLPTSALRWRVTSDGNGLHVSYVTSAGTTSVSGTYAGPIQVSGGSFVRVRFSSGQGRDYRNAVRVLRSGTSSLRSLAVMPMESYLYGVVPRESMSSWPAAALQAQSIAARSYSQYKKDHVSSTQVYDICDTTQCQVFGGSARYDNANDATTRESLEATSTTNAVKATAGVIRTYGGKAIFAEFSASNGGWSTDGGTPYLVAKADPWDGLGTNPVHSWKAVLPVTALECRYGPKNGDGSCAKDANGRPLWRLTRLTITQRDGNGEWGGRVEEATILFLDGAGSTHSVAATGSGIYFARPWTGGSDTGLRGRWFHITPEYDAGIVSRSSAPTLVRRPGVATGTLTAVVKNTGNAGWPVSGLHLALASPAGGADPLARGSSRPGAYVANLTTPGATTVAPGEQARFSVPIDAGSLAAGTRTAAYRVRIGTAALFGPTVAWSVVIKDARLTAAVGAPPALVGSTYAPGDGGPPALFADRRTVVVPRSGSTTLRLTSANTGNVTWPADASTPVVLGTSGPRDRTSPSASGWISATRVSRVVAPASIAPGGAGTFELPLAGNGAAAGVSTEAFEPLWTGYGWIGGATTALTVVRVDPAVSRLTTIDRRPASGFKLVNAPTGRADLVLRMRNLGRDAWTVGQERLKASTTPLAYRWIGSDNPSTLSRNLSRPGVTRVFPGEVGEWVIPVTGVKGTPGSTYSFTVRLATPQGTAYGPTSTVKVTVLPATFTAQLQLVRSSVDVPTNGHAATYYYVKNTGNVSWPVGGALRSTVKAGSSPSRYTSWYSASRPGSLTSNATVPGAAYVKPGQVARFVVVLAGNGRAAGKRSELFGISWDGWRSNPLSVAVAYRIV